MLFSAYGDVSDFLSNAAPNVETASLVGGNTQLAAPALLGATTLQVLSTSGMPAAPTAFVGYLLDGPNSERVIATVVDGTHVSLSAGTLAAHAALVSFSSAGTAGCLADLILQASATLEYKCAQGPDGGERGLWQQSRTETLSGPSMRAVIDRDRTVRLRPYHFPVASVSSLALQFGGQPSSALDLTYLTLPDGARAIEVPATVLQTTNPPGVLTLGYSLPRAMDFYAILSYVGGPIAGTTSSVVPYAIKYALYLLTLDRLAWRQNPLGVTFVRRGDVAFGYGKGAKAGSESRLMQEACEVLSPYMTPAGW